ncbi:MAG: hypothetical protein EP319_11075 [Deltaproteobacteria bacterium]|nr:MAG: hypothetical protein EP319_11075 [Deltaproteobacteria bacterium]
MKNLVFILLLIALSACSSLPGKNSKEFTRSFANTDTTTCFEALDLIANDSQVAIRKAQEYITKRLERNLPVHIDVGGEGRYEDALNINPGKYTSTTGEAGRLIPNWVYGRSDELPLPDGSVHKLTVESAPLNDLAISEILRVMRPRSQIELYHPTEYADRIHKSLIEQLERSNFNIEVTQSKDDIATRTIIQLNE